MPDETIDKNEERKNLSGAARAGFSERGFIIFTGITTSTVAFSIDMMLPALIDIGNHFRVQNQNDIQLVIVSFLFAFGISQLFFGPLTDSFGRKKILTLALFAFGFSSIAAYFAPSFEWLLLARIASGLSAGAARSASTAIVRDCFSGSDMARILSHVFAVFMIAPIIAPPIGQLIVYLSDWHFIFMFLGLVGLGAALWATFGYRETLHIEDRRPFSLAKIVEAIQECLSYRRPTGYGLVNLFIVSALFTFISSSAQIFGELYGLGDWFLAVFTLSAVCLASCSVLNAHLVKIYDMRLLMHWSLVVFFLVSCAFMTMALLGPVPLLPMVVIVVTVTSMFGFTNANSMSVALEPLGHVAGTASSIIATFGASGGALFGGIIARAYDGTVLPMAFGYLILSAAGLLAAYWGERGRLVLWQRRP